MPLSALPLFHRVAGQRVVLVGDGPAAQAKRRLVERAGGVCCPETEAHHARIAFVAIDDPNGAEATALRLRRKGLLVNVADRPELCDFTVPSILERDPLLIAVGTAGFSAGLAKQVRLRLEALLPPTLGALAKALHSARDSLRAKWPDAAERRRALDAALTQGGALDVFVGDSAERVTGWLREERPAWRDRTEEILLGSSDPDDLTLRQARLLGEADVVVHDPDLPQAILARARADAIRSTDSDGHTSGLTVIIKRIAS